MSGPVEIPLSERFRRGADRWAEERVMAEDAALEAKAEQALLEIEHLATGAETVEFDVDEGAIRYEPSPELSAFLDAQADETGVDRETVLLLYVDLFAGAFLSEDSVVPE
ncbi:hypothetical protein U4E84_04575 [Halorubrum sp. AD140]|uniref:hypothetical protein n=1 Tax=Halorubrum sp. AD140 TaxID=3050073 RepID=UPI002ACCE4CA|nr:hypothetical protein [Halorubrum sp. AD140]MDZ5810620.1 hypothetical protein [Halorubrum sp. AD140]